MYVYLQPRGGLNDILCVIQKCITYCKEYNRILLIDTFTKSSYNVNFSDYFDFINNNIIYDINKIIPILNNYNNSVYPSYFNNKLTDILNNNIQFTYVEGQFKYNNIILTLPKFKINEKIIIYSACGGGDGYRLFRQLKIKTDVRELCVKRYNSLVKPYICLQIRNTDYKCDYKTIYYNNKDLIQSYKNIYVATDDKAVIDYFNTEKLPITNFTTFPTTICKNLHNSDVPPHIKMIDMLSDIYIISLADKLLSNSKGGFINLVRQCNTNKNNVINQFK